MIIDYFNNLFIFFFTILQPEHNYKTGDVFTQLETCSKKANLLMKQLQVKSDDTKVLHQLAPEQVSLSSELIRPIYLSYILL